MTMNMKYWIAAQCLDGGDDDDADDDDADDDDDDVGDNGWDCCAQRLISKEIPTQDNWPCGRPLVADDDDDFWICTLLQNKDRYLKSFLSPCSNITSFNRPNNIGNPPWLSQTAQIISKFCWTNIWNISDRTYQICITIYWRNNYWEYLDPTDQISPDIDGTKL